jgi:hypothetical protein
VTSRREHRNRVPRAMVGFNNALFLTGDRKYVDAWRTMMDAVNANARTVNGKKEYPTMYGAEGWYGWQSQPWNVGALELWYFSMRPDDLARVSKNPWVDYLQGRNPGYPETALLADLASIKKRVEGIRADKSLPDKRLADNMLDLNPAATAALIHLTMGGWEPGRDGGLLNARLRYFDPARRRAGLPEEVAALISEMTDTRTAVTLVNLSKTDARTLVIQGGAYAEHQIESVTWNGKEVRVGAPHFEITLKPGTGGSLQLNMRRYASTPTVQFPWDRQ